MRIKHAIKYLCWAYYLSLYFVLVHLELYLRCKENPLPSKGPTKRTNHCSKCSQDNQLNPATSLTKHEMLLNQYHHKRPGYSFWKSFLNLFASLCCLQSSFCVILVEWYPEIKRGMLRNQYQGWKSFVMEEIHTLPSIL